MTSGVSGTKASSDEMAAVAANFDQKNESLQQILSSLMTKLSGLTTSWQGLGGQAFEDVKIRYAADLKKLNQALADTAEAIRLSGAGYASTDTDAASRVSSTSGNFQLPL